MWGFLVIFLKKKIQKKMQKIDKGEPLVYKGDSLAAKAFKNIANRIEGVDVPLLNLDVKMSLLDKIKFVFKR
ncbi:hypothetical protein [Fusobacterium vincentii]|uniref:hypothetical protein n=1 Tax=Fusobacterium vincentii TaxID=155615 RepID=UPI003CC66C8B